MSSNNPNDYLLKESLTKLDIKRFLDAICYETDLIKQRVPDNSDDAVTKAAQEDLDNLHKVCQGISRNLGAEIELTKKEKGELKDLLLLAKGQIERSLNKGITSGIESYLDKLY